MINIAKKCYICEKGYLVKRKVDYTFYGSSLGKFDAEVCNKCHETFFSEETSKQMTQIAKELGLYGLQAKKKIGQAGTVLGIRLPKKIIGFLGLKNGREVEKCPEGKHKLIISA